MPQVHLLQLLLVAVCSAVPVVEAEWTIGQQVKTSSGLVMGHASSWKSEVSEYLGIPYANAPVGQLRFAAPQAYNGTGTIAGKNFVRFLIQNDAYTD